MKTCSVCRKPKKFNEFNLNKSKADGHDYYCRTCRKHYRNRHYIDNREKYMEYSQQHKRRCREAWGKILLELFGALKCYQCGYDDYPEILEYHHGGGKTKDPCEILRQKPSTKAIEEIEKCVPMCPNCHRVIHRHERGG